MFRWVNHLQLPYHILKPIFRNPREGPQTLTSPGCITLPDKSLTSADCLILRWPNHLQLPHQISKPIIRNPREAPQTRTSRGLCNILAGQSLTIALSNPQTLFRNPREVYLIPPYSEINCHFFKPHCLKKEIHS